MGKLANRQFGTHAIDGAVRFMSEVSVSTDGTFAVSIPDWLVKNAREACRERENKCDVQTPRKNAKVYGRDLQACFNVVQSALDVWAKPKMTEEIVILYRAECHAAFWRGDDGKIYPNGYIAQDAGAAGSWVNGMGDHHAGRSCNGGYSLHIGARVLHKKTKQRGGVKEIDFEWFHGPEGSWAEKLNSFCAVGLDGDEDEDRDASLREMPYTEEAAKFFYTMMLGMCQLIDNVERYFAVDAATLEKRITQNSPLKLFHDAKGK